MNEIIGFLSAIVIGFTLGLIGGGGSILTVPVLVYIVGINPVLSTAYSLFIVGTTALLGSFSYMRQGLLSYRTAIVFSIPAFVAVYATRKFIVPAIPDIIFESTGFSLTKDLAVMLFFAAIMLLASISMIRIKKQKSPVQQKSSIQEEQKEISYNYPFILLEGVLVGVVTGLVGAGGGFLIIPALVLLARLPMKLAVGTSLLIIAAKSLIGFLGDVGNQPIDWGFLSAFTAIAILGIFLGSYSSRLISPQKLRATFGWFVFVMALYILIKELFF
ncbi:sulfite exporter TauE/SafE family protein [Fulvivirga sp. M361]|uniref:sulfite exporter TauE/SafE family protein n=1 Tax=Fulvivirga sp. M361 TaxID=2594266 RepID=UPI00117BAC0B|nr:sulfite exporter TauE/SafE family protein [Fulvivirga sp. M361]TRX55940.1 sulfite exporter TauE/SafE family protein [Fulvivirga sp. M361]